jgi:peptide/nickel transport system substrate-binding protein
VTLGGAGDRRDPDEGLSRRELLRDGAAIGLFATGVFAGCDWGGGDDEDRTTSRANGGGHRRGGRLTVALHDGGPQDTLAPWNTPTYSSAARAEQVYERLFELDAGGVPRPRLALSAEGNADGSRWRVKLREGVTFHDGKTMTAQDVLYSYRYVADEKNKAESLARLDPVDLNASRAVSSTELDFRLKRPIGDFPGLLAQKVMWVVPEGKTNFNKPNGTGPFVFVEWRPGVRALYKRNENYWGLGQDSGPFVEELELQTIVDQSARLNALLGGQVEEITLVDFVSAKAQANNDAVTIVRSKQPSVLPIYMQIDHELFRDNRVRQAMKLAIDREQMVRNVVLGFGQVGNDLFGLGHPSYNADLPQREHDPEQAAALLKQAGAENLRLTLPSSEAVPGMLQTGTAFKQHAKAAGIEITIEKLPAETYFTNNKYLKVPFYQTTWVDSFEAQAQDGLLRNAPYNETHWFRPEWDKEFQRAQAIVDRDQRNAAYKALQEPLWEEGGYVIWGAFDTLDAIATKVKGVVPNRSSGYQNLGGLDFKDHWLA